MSFFHAILFGVPTQPRMTNKPRATWVQSVDLCAPLCHVLLTTMLQGYYRRPKRASGATRAHRCSWTYSPLR